MANFWGGWTPPRHSGTWVGARVASLRCHYPPPRRSQYSRNAKARPHKSKTSCRGGHRRGTTISCPGRGPLAGFEVTLYGRICGDHRGAQRAEDGATRLFRALGERVRSYVERYQTIAGVKHLRFDWKSSREFAVSRSEYPAVALRVTLNDATIEYRHSVWRDDTVMS